MLRAALDDFDSFVLVSADSDFAPAAELIKERFLKIEIDVIASGSLSPRSTRNWTLACGYGRQPGWIKSSKPSVCRKSGNIF
jgi:hypothetical protein